MPIKNQEKLWKSIWITEQFHHVIIATSVLNTHTNEIQYFRHNLSNFNEYISKILCIYSSLSCTKQLLGLLTDDYRFINQNNIFQRNGIIFECITIIMLNGITLTVKFRYFHNLLEIYNENQFNLWIVWTFLAYLRPISKLLINKYLKMMKLWKQIAK